ncbi:MAG TPA: heme NO-binding domain-containing protein [Polyangiales bacterium]
MKGTISRCLASLVRKRGGPDAWSDVVRAAGAGEAEFMLELAGSDVEDDLVLRLFKHSAERLRLTEHQIYDAFGEHWCVDYAPKVYGAIISRFASAREMILGLDRVHVHVTATMARARPPRFEYAWSDERTLLVTYKSTRSLIGLYIGLARGVGKLFGERLVVAQDGPNRVRIVFEHA